MSDQISWAVTDTDNQPQPAHLEMPLHWRTARHVVVRGDLFHEQVPDDFIYQVFTVMAVAYRHTFQVRTDYPGRMARLLSTFGVTSSFWQGVGFATGRYGADLRAAAHIEEAGGIYSWPLRNVEIDTVGER